MNRAEIFLFPQLVPCSKLRTDLSHHRVFRLDFTLITESSWQINYGSIQALLMH